MLRATLLAAILAGAAQDPGAKPGHALYPLGPVGHWKGDDGGADASGNGRAATCAPGAATSKEVPKTKFANAGSFGLDGKTGMVTVPDAPQFRFTGDFTIAFWKRKTAVVADWVRLIGKGGGGPRNYGIWEFPGEEGRIKFQMYSPTGQSVLELDSPAATPFNAWSHIACLVSVNTAMLFIDGKLVATGLRNGEPATSADPLTFGFAGFHGYFPGQLDDIRLYDRALSSGEIVHLAAGQGPPDPPAGLAAASAAARRVELKWTAPATPPPPGTATVYLVKRGGTVVASSLTSTSWADEGVEPGKSYSYVVTAVTSAGESVPSNELKLSTPGP